MEDRGSVLSGFGQQQTLSTLLEALRGSASQVEMEAPVHAQPWAASPRLRTLPHTWSCYLKPVRQLLLSTHFTDGKSDTERDWPVLGRQGRHGSV